MGLIAHAFVEQPEHSSIQAVCAHVARHTVKLESGASYTVTDPCLQPREHHNAR